jgi:hypothetical protein
MCNDKAFVKNPLAFQTKKNEVGFCIYYNLVTIKNDRQNNNCLSWFDFHLLQHLCPAVAMERAN